MSETAQWLRQFEDAYSEHAQGLFRYLCRMTHDRQQSEDIVHEAFIRVFGGAAPREDSNLAGLLWVTARNLAISYLRGKARLKAASAEHAGEAEADPSRQAMESELKDKVNALIDDLPPLEREVIVMKIHGGLSYEGIGQVLGCPVGTVKSRMNRAFKKLRKRAEGLI